MKTKLPPEVRQMLPLTPAVFFVLFSLASGDKHGYAIMQDTATFSSGEFRMGPGTLYGYPYPESEAAPLSPDMHFRHDPSYRAGRAKLSQ